MGLTKGSPLSTRRKIVVGACAVAASGGAWVAWDAARENAADTAKAHALRKTIEARGGFAVVTDRLQERVGPHVVLPERPVRLVDLGASILGPFQSLADALPPYPDGFIKRFVDTVALARSIEFWADTTIGGFFYPRGLCLDMGNWAQETKQAFTDLFHHEFSSLVRLAEPFDEARWESFNPPGFGYLDEAAYRALIKHKPHAEGDDALRNQGFVRPYGKSSPDDDWNTFAEQVFGHATSFATLIKPFPRLRGKTGMMIDVYERLDPRFAPYFESTGLRIAAAG